MVYAKYCTCLITHNVKNNSLIEGAQQACDVMTFGNPDHDPGAEARCVERARNLRAQGKVAVPILIQQIVEEI